MQPKLARDSAWAEAWGGSQQLPWLDIQGVQHEVQCPPQDLLHNGLLGTAMANIRVVEWQKRGLSHDHILIILRNQDKLHDSNDYDRIVCAELLDKSTHPELCNIVTSRMLHGPCGALHPSCACMVNGACNKGYPKTFQPQTKDSTGSYPTYRRRDDSRTFTHPT